MRLHSKLLIVVSLFITACSEKPVPTTTAGPSPSTAVSTDGSKSSVEAEKPADSGAGAAAQTPNATATPDTSASQPTPVALEAGVAKLGPENTKVLFVGTHVGPNPDPRTGGFERFSGEVKVDADAKALMGLSVKIETDSLWTQIGPLTQHLKSPDFFEVREYPSIDFESTSIKAGAAEGTYEVTGNLTLHGVTKEITFPVTAQITDGGLTLTSQFSVNRTDYGMTFSPERVVDKVELTVVVGEKTAPLPAQGFGPGGGGGGGGRPGGGGGGGRMPDFAEMDKDSDGKLTKEEFPEGAQRFFDFIDTNKDGSIDKAEHEESLKRMRERMQQGGGPGGAPGGPGGGGPGGAPGAGAPGAGAPPAGAPDEDAPDSGASEPEADDDQESEEPENDPSVSP